MKRNGYRLGVGAVVVLIVLSSFSGMASASDSITQTASGLPQGQGQPLNFKPFDVPESLVSLIGEYRKQFANVSALSFSALHWNHYVSIYVDQGARVYRNNFSERLTQLRMDEEDEEYDPAYQSYPVGTVFVKEHFIAREGQPGEATQLSVMIKRDPGYDSQFGDWEYIQTANGAGVVFQGNSKDPAVFKACVECHQNIADRDYIFAINYQKSE